MKNEHEKLSRIVEGKSINSLNQIVEAIDAFMSARELMHYDDPDLTILPNSMTLKRTFIFLCEEVLRLKSDMVISVIDNDLYMIVGEEQKPLLLKLRSIIEVEIRSRESGKYPLISEQSLYLYNSDGPPKVLDFSSKDGDSDLFRFCKVLFDHSQKNPDSPISRSELKRRLQNMGVDKDRLIEENFIDSTYGNLKKKINKKGLDSRIKTSYSKNDKGYFFKVK